MTYKIEIRTIDINNILFVDNITDDVEVGFSIVEKLNEELDIGALLIPFSTKSTTYGMLDTVRIYIDNVEIYSMRIGGDELKLVSKNPLLYSHSLSLVEHTKILERVIISGKTFTQPTREAIINGATPLTLFDVVETLMNVYPFETSANLSSTRMFSIPTAVETYLTAIQSPEFTFKDITLREALNRVLSYVDGVARLNEGSELSIDFFNELVDLISDETGIYNKSKVQDITYHGTDMTVDALNLVNDNIESEGVEVYPAPNQYISLRSDQYIFDFTKSFIPTPKKIYSIESLNVYMALTITDTVGTPTYFNGNTTINIGDRVLEKKAYDIQPVASLSSEDEKKEKDKFFQANTVYYEYGKKNIQVGATADVWDDKENLLWTINMSILQWAIDEGHVGSGTVWGDLSVTWAPNLDKTLSNIYYTPMQRSLRFNIDRQDLTDVNRKSTLISNQQSRVINMENFLNNVQGKINKIGNTELKLFNRVNSIGDVYNVSDYTNENYVLTNKELIFYKDFIDCSYEASRNWNMLSQFIAVNSEMRQYEIGEADRTLERDVIYKEFIEIDAVASGSGTRNDIVGLNDYGVETYLETFLASSTKTNVAVGFIYSTDTVIDSSIIGLSANGGGNNLIFSFEFDDNKVNAKNIETINSQRAVDFVSYTDEEGKLETIELRFCEDIQEIDYLTNLAVSEALPKLSSAYAVNKQIEFTGLNDLHLEKDNREIIKGVYSLQQISLDVNKVVIGRYLSRRNRLVNSIPPTMLYLHTYDNDIKFRKNDTLKALSGATDKTALNATTLVVSTINEKVTVSHSSLDSTNSSYCITDENDNILIAVNQDGTLLNVLTFDFLNKRSGINYNY